MDIENRQGAELCTGRPRLYGLYAITPDLNDTDELVSRVAAALRGGAAAVQYRNKTADATLARTQAVALVHLCRRHRVPLIVNDDFRLALAVDATGVHIGAQDGDWRAVRQEIGPDKLLGVSCYGRFDLAEAAGDLADYVAFGSVFASATKPQAARATLELLTRAKLRGWNTVAIGGIRLSNAATAVAAGADALAVIGELFNVETIDSVEQRARALSAVCRCPAQC